MVSAAGLSATYPGFQKAQGTDLDNRLRAAQATNAETELAGQAAFGNTLKMFQQQVPGAQPMPGGPQQAQGGMPQAPAPGQPSVPMRPQQQPQPQMQQGGGQPMGGAQAQPQGQPSGSMMPGGGQIMPQGQQGMGQLDWRVIMGKVAQANPNAPPQVLAAAVNKFLPLMTQQSQMDWKQVQLALMAQRTDQGQQRVDISKEESGRRQEQGQQRIDQSGQRLGLAQDREARLAAGQKVRQDQQIQRLDLAKQNLERQITQGGQRQKLSEWRATVDAQHKRAMEVIQSNALGSNLSDPDKKALLQQEDQFYRSQLENMRNMSGSSTPTGGKPAAGGKTTDRVPAYNPSTGKIE